ncbi:hypothetical protein ACO1O0_007225 [Amphichorda felina]
MKFSFFAIAALFGVAAATTGGSAETTSKDFQVKAKRQRPAVNAPAMSDANGSVIPYSREGVTQNKQKRKAKRVAAAKAQMVE